MSKKIISRRAKKTPRFSEWSVDLTGKWPKILRPSGPSAVYEWGPGAWLSPRDWRLLSKEDRESLAVFLANLGRHIVTETHFCPHRRRTVKMRVHVELQSPATVLEGCQFGHSVHVASGSLRHERLISILVADCDTQEEANQKVREWIEDLTRVWSSK